MQKCKNFCKKKKKCCSLEKNADSSKIKEVLVLKGIFSKTTYVYVLMYQILGF